MILLVLLFCCHRIVGRFSSLANRLTRQSDFGWRQSLAVRQFRHKHAAMQRLQPCCSAIEDQVFGHWTRKNDSNILQTYTLSLHRIIESFSEKPTERLRPSAI